MDTREVVEIYAAINLEKVIKKRFHKQLSEEFTQNPDNIESIKTYIQKETQNLQNLVDAVTNPLNLSEGQRDKVIKMLVNTWNATGQSLERMIEDVPTFVKYLRIYMEKNVGGFPWHTGTFKELRELTEKYISRTGIGNLPKTLDQLKEEVEVVEEGPNWMVVVPKTEKASVTLGKGTEWCTAYDTEEGKNCAFEQYNEQGNIYVIINKDNPTEERYQYHPATGQFADVADNMIRLSEVLPKMKELEDFFKPVLINILDQLEGMSTESLTEYVQAVVFGESTGLLEELIRGYFEDKKVIYENHRDIDSILEDVYDENLDIIVRYIKAKGITLEDEYEEDLREIEEKIRELESQGDSELMDILERTDRNYQKKMYKRSLRDLIETQLDEVINDLELVQVNEAGKSKYEEDYKFDFSRYKKFPLSPESLRIIDAHRGDSFDSIDIKAVVDILAPDGRKFYINEEIIENNMESSPRLLNQTFQKEAEYITKKLEKEPKFSWWKPEILL